MKSFNALRTELNYFRADLFQSFRERTDILFSTSSFFSGTPVVQIVLKKKHAPKTLATALPPPQFWTSCANCWPQQLQPISCSLMSSSEQFFVGRLVSARDHREQLAPQAQKYPRFLLLKQAAPVICVPDSPLCLSSQLQDVFLMR